MSLPTLIDPTTAAMLTGQEAAILQTAVNTAATLVGAVGAPCARMAQEIAESLRAISLAAELSYAHESPSPADTELHHAATQLKLWHLYRLDQLLA